MLVVDVDALGLVDLLDLAHEVQLGVRPALLLGLAAEREQLVRVQGPLVELVADLDALALSDVEDRPRRERVAMLLAAVVGDDHGLRLVGLLDRHLAADLGDLRQALRLARLEQLDDTRQTVRDVRAGDTAGVERPHRQLRARLTDRLGGDDPDRVTDLRELAGRERAAVARLAHAGRRLALQHRTDRNVDDVALVGVLGPGLDEIGELGPIDLLALLDDHPAALGRDLLRRDPPDQVVVRLARRPQPPGLRIDLELRHRHLDELLGAAVLLTDDHVLGDVDEAPGQIPGVRRTERRVRETLAGTVRRDEVLEHGQAFHEVGLDRTLE